MDRDSHYIEAYHIKLTSVYRFKRKESKISELSLGDKKIYRTTNVGRLFGTDPLKLSDALINL
jgi:hypothetical protein